MQDNNRTARCRTDPALVYARHPKDVPNGSLVLAPWRDKFFPALKWAADNAGDPYFGLAFLQSSIEPYDHPVSLSTNHTEHILLVESPRHFQVPLDRSPVTTTGPKDYRHSGLVFCSDGTYRRIPIIPARGQLLSWQAIHIESGHSPSSVSDRNPMYAVGWDLYIGDQETTFSSWEPNGIE